MLSNLVFIFPLYTALLQNPQIASVDPALYIQTRLKNMLVIHYLCTYTRVADKQRLYYASPTLTENLFEVTTVFFFHSEQTFLKF